MFVVEQNTYQVQEIEANGDWTNDTVYYTLKKDKTESNRIVDTLVTDKTYNSATDKTLFKVPLIPAENQELTAEIICFWDLKTENSSTDRELIAQGSVRILHTVRRDSDVLPPEYRDCVVLQVANLQEGYYIGKVDASGRPVAQSRDELRYDLGINNDFFYLT